MKKAIYIFLFLLCAAKSYATGTVTFTLVTTPCDTNGVLVAHFPVTSGTGPYQVFWYGGSTSCEAVHAYTIMPTTDTLRNYIGSSVTCWAYDSSWTPLDTGTFAGAPPFTFTFGSVATFCPGTLGNASVTVTGGTPPYSYKWIDFYSGTVMATTNPAGLPSGVYGIKITDAFGCTYGTFNFCTTDTVSITATPTFSITTTTTVANCTDGTATVAVVSGGTPYPPFSYSWSTGASTSTISGLVMGNYSVTVTDSHGCQAYDFPTINQSVTINVPTTPTPATCIATDGAIIAFGSGGVSPYSYVWSNGATTQNQTGIASGYYTVVATDANGCIGNGSGYVGISTPITVSYSTTPSSCTAPTGSATAIITGGTPPYNITWYTSPIQTTATASSLAPGTYSFNITDAMSCVQTGIVVVPPVDIINLAFSVTPALCTLATGSLAVVPSGGVAPYTYHWSTGSTAPSIASEIASLYHVTVTDANSCTVTGSQLIPSISPVSVGMATTPASCLFVNDGSAYAAPVGGTAPYSYSWWPTGGSAATATGLHTDEYWVSVTDASGCYAQTHSHVGYNVSDSSCFCVIKGNIYYDINGNCVKDAGEPGIHNIQVYCSGIGYTYTNDSGDYYFLVPTGTYTVSETVLSYYPLTTCAVNNVVVTATAATGCVHVVNFANSINPIHSVHIRHWDYNQPVPGNTYTQACIVSNEGTVTESAILGGYKTDGQLFGATFTPSGIFTLGGTDWYSTAGGSGLSLVPGSSQFFSIDYNVPTFIPLGTNVIFKDTVAYTAPMSNWLSDYSPWDNLTYRTATTVASFDPNFKEVYPQGAGAAGNITYDDSVLEYMVHFQNTGTYMAQNITVIDTLSPNLDWATLRPVYASGKCQITLSETGVLKYTFKNIDLPPAGYSNDLSSNGMFTYTIKTLHGLPGGTQFKNSASIYFDYNAPIKTNTTLNTLMWPHKVATVTEPNEFFHVYPNPASNSFNMVINSETSVTAQMMIEDITGKTITGKTLFLQQGENTITNETGHLASGMYFVTIKMDNKLQTQKLVIMK